MLLLEERDAEELVLVLQGYYLLLTDRTLSVLHVRTGNEEIGKYSTVQYGILVITLRRSMFSCLNPCLSFSIRLYILLSSLYIFLAGHSCCGAGAGPEPEEPYLNCILEPERNYELRLGSESFLFYQKHEEIFIEKSHGFINPPSVNIQNKECYSQGN